MIISVQLAAITLGITKKQPLQGEDALMNIQCKKKYCELVKYIYMLYVSFYFSLNKIHAGKSLCRVEFYGHFSKLYIFIFI